MTLTPEEMEQALRDALVEITALSDALVRTKKLTQDELDTFRMTAEPIVDQKLRKIRNRTSSHTG